MSAGGTLTQLVALGAQNTYLSGGGGGSSFGSCTSCNSMPQTEGAYVCDATQKKCIFINDIKNTRGNMLNKNDVPFTSLSECEKTCQ
jgi:hypothetical protein